MICGSSKDVSEDPTVYDFANEKRLYMILGGYFLLKEPVICSILNKVWLVFYFLLCPYLFISGVITFYSTSDKGNKTELLHEMCLFIALPMLSISGIFTRESLEQALNSFKSGVYLYDEENEKILEIKKKYIEQFRTLKGLVYVPIAAFAFSRAILFPLLRLLSTGAKLPINNYLPLRLYVPYNTETPIGFLVTFIFQAIFFWSVDIIFTCQIEIYVGCAMQFTAQLDILNYLLKDIQRRAYFGFINGKSTISAESNYFESAEFQRNILLCLKDSIRHHHAILKLQKYIGPFIESTCAIGIVFFSLLVATGAVPLLENPSGNVALIFFLSLTFIGFFTMCWVGQLISDKSSELMNSLYSTPWPMCEKKFRVMMNIMMKNFQNPIVFRTKGFGYSISLETYADMVTVAYKVINVLW